MNLKEVLNKIKKFFKGYSKSTTYTKPKNFLEYFVKFPVNWLWTIGSIAMFIRIIISANQYKSPALFYLSSIPLIMLVYDVIDEYFAYQYFKTNKRGISAKNLALISYGLCTTVLVYIMFRVITE